MIATLRLWQLISPALPIGAFSFSQGLEQAVERGAVRDEATALAWIAGVLEHGLAYTDLPIVLRAHAAAAGRDAPALARCGETLTAFRETAEARLEDASMGAALESLLAALGVPIAAGPLPFACAFGGACAAWQIEPRAACAGYAFAWCEAQTAAAVKLVPLGHTAGQRLLLALGAPIERAAAAAFERGDDDLGASLPGLALASALHETQYTRLFRS